MPEDSTPPPTQPEPQPPDDQPAVKPRSRSRELAYTVFILLAFFAIIETTCRLSPLNPLKNRHTGNRLGAVILDPHFHHRFAPDLNMVDNNRSIPYPLITNSEGWCEDYDISLEKPAGTRRIFYVGDSNTQCVVAPGKKMVDIVEQTLNERYHGNPPLEVINTGTSSYSPMLYYLTIRDRILAYDPDLVVVNVDMTDVVNDRAYNFTAQYDDETGDLLRVVGGQSEALKNMRMTPRGLVPISRLQRLSTWLGDHSAFYATLQGIFGNRGALDADLSSAGDGNADWLRQDWNAEVEANVQHSMQFLEKIASLLKQKHIPLLITSVPHYPQFTGEMSPRPNQALADTAERCGVPFLNGYEAMKEAVQAAPAGTYYWPEDPTHLNIEGNALWAQAQLKALEPLVANLCAPPAPAQRQPPDSTAH